MVGVVALLGIVVAAVVFVATRPSTRAAARQTSLISQGKSVYTAHCAVCHGGQGQGSAMGPAMFSNEFAALPDASYRNAIADGVANRRPQYGPMPAQHLTDAQASQVIAYVRDAQAKGTP